MGGTRLRGQFGIAARQHDVGCDGRGNSQFKCAGMPLYHQRIEELWHEEVPEQVRICTHLGQVHWLCPSKLWWGLPLKLPKWFLFCSQSMVQHRVAANDARGATASPRNEVIISIVQCMATSH